MAARFKSSIKADGPFFRKDPDKVFRQNAHDMMEKIAETARDDVIGQMVRGEPGRAPIKKLGDRVADHVVGELRKRPAGNRYTAVVFVRNHGFSRVEAISLMAAASRLEGDIHAFRRTFSALRRNRAVTQAELWKGLN